MEKLGFFSFDGFETENQSRLDHDFIFPLNK